MYKVQYYNEDDHRWCEVGSPIMPTKYLTEAERLASVRSEKSVRLFRIRKYDKTVSTWRKGKQLPRAEA